MLQQLIISHNKALSHFNVMYKCAIGKMSGCPEGFDKFPLANREIDFPNLYRANIIWNKENYCHRLNLCQDHEAVTECKTLRSNEYKERNGLYTMNKYQHI